MRKEASSAGSLLVFLVYGMFALFSLLLVVIGAGVYRDIVASGRQNTELRASLFYLSNQVRMCSGEAELAEQDGLQVLVLRDEGSEGETLIYYKDGALCEYYGPAGTGASFAELSDMGERVAALDGLQFGQDGGMLTVTVSLGGEERQMALCGAA